MSVNIRNPITGELTNASGGIINPKSINEMIAPIEDGTASKAYAVGEQFIMNDLLCEATQAIAQGDTMVIGTNCEESEQLSKQVKDINTSLTANGNRFEAGYSSANDEYGFNIGSTFYPIGASSGGDGGSQVQLDWANPLHTFSGTGNTTWITTQDGYLSGQYGQNLGTTTQSKGITIDGTQILRVIYSGGGSSTNYFVGAYVPPIRVAKGSTIVVDDDSPALHFYEGSVVSPEVTVFNEAELTLDYANPLHTFSSGNLSYTATKDCWVVGNLWGTNDGKLYINNTGLSFATYDGTVATSTNVLLKVSRGDTVTVNRACPYLCILEGTVSGSVGALHSNIPDYSNLIASLTSEQSTYTATEECIVEIQAVVAQYSTYKVNGNNIGYSYSDGTIYLPFNKAIHLQKGDVLSWDTSSPTALFVCNVFGVL